jgi:DNA-binding NarL/FixJ family response regulator
MTEILHVQSLQDGFGESFSQPFNVPRCILLVDDSASVLESLKRALEGVAGWRVGGEALNGREAIAEAAALQPDLAILDFSMPVMNGQDAARELSSTMARLPLVIFTTFHTPEIKRQAISSGCSRVVAKTQISELIAAVHQIFDNVA